MGLVADILISLVIIGIIFWLIKRNKYEKKYDWITKAPGHPIFGNVWELRNSKELLKAMLKLSNGCNGICFIDLIFTKPIIVSNTEILEFILTSTKMLDKGSEYRFLKKWLGNGLLTGTGKRWKNSRKIITPAFHFSILRQFISVYESNADLMIQLLEKELEKDSVDIYPYLTMCTLDIICETSMGVSLNAQTNRQSKYVHAVKQMCKIMVNRTFAPLKKIDLLYPLCKDFYKELNYVNTLHTHTKAVIQSRKTEFTNKCIENENEAKENVYADLGTKKKVAFLDLLLQSKLDGKPLPDWYIREEVDTLMFEGHDTTSAAISFTLYCLTENPKVQIQTIEEQKRIFGKDRHRPVTFQDIQDMKYLELVIKETLRLYPSVPFIARNSETDIEYKDGCILPKNTTFILCLYVLHRDPNIFPDPEKFDPKRFENADNISPFSFLPFSAGPRNCIGQKFAMYEMKTILSKVLRTYEFLPANPRHIPLLIPECVLLSANGIKVSIKERHWE